ncbi:unnamed protein product [Sphagnum compactum]
MRSGTRGWSLPRSQTTHVQSDCESSIGSSSSSAAAHPSPLMSTRGRELSLHLRQQRLQLLNSIDGGFNYINAAKAAKAANHMVCNTVSSTLNSESVVVLYRAFLKILKKHDRITGSHIRRKPASLGTCERSRGEGVREQSLSSARDGLELPGTVVPETRQVEGLAAEALSGSPAGV